MFEKLKSAKYYGLSKETYDNCFDIIQEGNDKSLAGVLLITAGFLAVMTGGNFLLHRPAAFPLWLTVVSVVDMVLFFTIGKYCRHHHHLFFYLAVEMLLIYCVYAMSFGTKNSLVLYPAVAVVLPLFHMHNMYSTTGFFLTNALVILLQIYLDPEHFHYMRGNLFVVLSFTFLGLVIHYVYQSNRLREFITYMDSHEKQLELEISSNFEPMSRLLRRRTFIELAEHMMNNKNDDQFMAMGILDVDHFKLINDTYGHQLGDEAIAVIGRVLAETLEVTLTMPDTQGFRLELDQDYGNIACRLGGDEYIFLIHSEGSRSSAEKLMNCLLETLNATTVGPLQSIGASIGVSVLENGAKSYDSLYHEADMALYHSKIHGRNRAAFYDPGMEMEKQEENEGKEKDALTGLLLSKVFKERAADVIKEGGRKYAIVNMDIENFKSYNSTYGFEKGDRFLQKVAELLVQTYPDELISRFSDDHFVALLPMEELEEKIEEIKFTLRSYHSDFKNALRVGIYKIEDPQVNINAACDHAIFACDTLRGRYDVQMQYFDEELHKKSDRYQYIVEHLDEALEKEWIKVYYQPIVRTETGEYCSLEALSRWKDPRLGFLPPGDFIETLERTRLIYKLDLYMVEQVCKDYRQCADRGALLIPISVNLSRMDFESIDVVKEIENIIQTYRVPKHALHIEITESALMEQEDKLKRIVDQFQQMEYQVWMDDFGSGYSSLNVLKDYRFNVIKLDMEFLRDSGQRSRIVLTSIVDMAKKLGLQTLTEGVETEEQYEFLRSIGCDYVQGFFFSRPVPLDEFIRHVKERNIRLEKIKRAEKETA